MYKELYKPVDNQSNVYLCKTLLYFMISDLKKDIALYTLIDTDIIILLKLFYYMYYCYITCWKWSTSFCIYYKPTMYTCIYSALYFPYIWWTNNKTGKEQ